MNPLDWLLASDPAIRYQAMRDLTEVSASALEPERVRIPLEGLGAAILAAQGPGGAWHRGGEPAWLPTLFTMQLLRATGVDPRDPALARAVTRLAHGFRWDAEFGAKPFFEGEEEPCINGGVLALGGYFGQPSHGLALRLMSEQLEDGGWNCEAPKSARASFHSTICVLEGLFEYERATGASAAIRAACRRGEEYLLERRLFRRLSNGEVADPRFLEFAYPPRYAYDVLRALDYFRAVGRAPDVRMSDAVSIVEERRRDDGRWALDRSHPEALAFAFPEAVGESSAWNTLRALRVLRWWEGAKRPE